MVEVVAIETPTLGDRSYLAHDGGVAVVIDPQRDIDRVTALAERHGVRITHVAETHIQTTTSAAAWPCPARPGRPTW